MYIANSLSDYYRRLNTTVSLKYIFVQTLPMHRTTKLQFVTQYAVTSVSSGCQCYRCNIR